MVRIKKCGWSTKRDGYDIENMTKGQNLLKNVENSGNKRTSGIYFG